MCVGVASWIFGDARHILRGVGAVECVCGGVSGGGQTSDWGATGSPEGAQVTHGIKESRCVETTPSKPASNTNPLYAYSCLTGARKCF